MADVKLNPILEQLSGKVGRLVFRRYGKRTVISRVPDRRGRELTELQKEHRERFLDAVAYGKRVMSDPEERALYEEVAEAEGVPVFSLTVGDYFNTPAVEEVDASRYTGAVGDEIIIVATDDFGVTGVEVVLTDDTGAEIERGAAVVDLSGIWTYTASVAVDPGTTVTVAVTARDRPGGTGTLEVEKTL